MASIDDVHAALNRVTYPGFQRDIVSLGMLRDVTLRGAHATLVLDVPSRRRAVAEEIQRAVADAVRTLDGISDVTVVSTTEERHAGNAPQTNRARQPLPGVAHVVAVASGKGGVGKSTVAVNLALALAESGLRVGLLDADVHGPSAPLMTGTSDARPKMLDGKKILPIQRYGITIVSMGFFLDDRSPVIWRGPMVMSIVRQFLKDVVWGELDVLVVDLPPGTGDAQLTLLQEVPIAGGVIVTTPQDVALQDVRRGIAMFATVQTPVLGIVENMSGYVCPQCHAHDPVFATDGGAREAEALDVPLLGRLGLVSELRAAMDRGAPLVVDQPSHPIAVTFRGIAARIASDLGLRNHESH